MPRYSADPILFPGEWPECRPIVVIDGNDAEVPYCVGVDTDTGEVLRQAVDGRGNMIIDTHTGICGTITEFRPLPIKVVPMSEYEPHAVR